MRSNTALRAALFAIAAAGLSPMVSAQPIVGGAPMLPTKDIIDNAVNSADHTTLVAAVKAAGLVETLSGPGPFTLFAPTDAAFKKLPAGTVESLLKPENKAKLAPVTGRHDVFLVLTNPKKGGGLMNIDWVQFDR